MTQPTPDPQSQEQSNLIQGTNVQGDLIFAPVQIGTKIETQIVQISVAKVTQQPLNTTSPYQGLKRFNFGDRERFFGRDELIATLFKAVNSPSNLSLVLGASGSGKSSVVRAGLIPKLKKSLNTTKFHDFIFTPQRDPFDSLYRCLRSEEKNYSFSDLEAKFVLEAKADTLPKMIRNLKKKDERWLIFVDQFEELFTYKEPEKCHNFIEGIVRVANSSDVSVKIVLAIRDDFLDQLSEYPKLGAIANQNNFYLVTKMHPDQLRQAIEQPAALHGVVFEEGLVEQIIKEVDGQKGFLPLLQYTLNLLWEAECKNRGTDGRRLIESRVLNRASYGVLGGVRGALQKHIDTIYEGFSEDEKRATQQIFSRLVKIFKTDSGSKIVSRRAYRDEFVSELVKNVLNKFIDEKLLVSSSDSLAEKVVISKNSDRLKPSGTIEIAHEILLFSWDALKKWIEEEKEAISVKNWLASETRRWQKIRLKNESKANDELLKGSRLDQVIKLRSKNAFENIGGLRVEENKFIDASVEQRNRQERRRQQITLGLSVGLVGALGLAGFAGWQWQRAENERKIAQLRQIVAQAGLIREQQPNEPQLNILLAIEVMRRKPDLEVEQVLKRGLDLLPASHLNIFHKDLESAILSADGKHLITTSGLRQYPQIEASIKPKEIVRVWNIDSGSEVINFHPEGIGNIVFSKNGKYLARASNKNVLKVWDMITGQEVIQIKHQEEFEFISLSSDGKYIAGASSKIVYIWEVSSGKGVAQLVHEHNIDRGQETYPGEMNFVFSPDSKYIATASYALRNKEYTAQVWEINSGKKVIQRKNQEPFYKIAFSPDSKYVATFAADIAASGSFSDNIVRIDELTTDLTVAELKHVNLHQSTKHGRSVLIKDMVFSPNGKYLATIDSGEGRSLTLWEVINGRKIFSLKHEGQGYKLNIKFSPDGKYLISTDNQTTKIWDATNGKEVARIPGSLGLYNPSTSNGKYLLTADGDTAKVWKVDNIGSNFLKVSYEDFARDIVFSPDGKHLASVGDSKTVKVWEIDKAKKTLEVDQDGMNAISFSSDGQYLATASKDSVQIWQMAGNQKIMQMKPSRLLTKLIFSQNGQYIAAVSGGTRLSDPNDIQIWDLTTGKEILHLKFERPVKSMAFSSDNKYIFTNVYLVNPSFKMWEINSGRTIFQIESEVNDFIFHPNRHYLALASPSGVLIWDLLNGKKIRTLKIDKTNVQHITYSPDGKYITTTSNEDITQIWEIESAKEIMKIKSTDTWLREISFSPDGKYISTAMKDNTARIWEMISGKEISRITHSNRVNTVAFSPNGKYIATASNDGTAFVSFWQPEDLISEACSRVTRNLSIQEWQQYFTNEPYQASCPNLPIPIKYDK